MSAQRRGDSYEVIVWDYDAAPDAVEWITGGYTEQEERESIAPHYCSKRVMVVSRQEAINIATREEEENFAVGAAVYLDGEEVFRIGQTFGYRKKYL